MIVMHPWSNWTRHDASNVEDEGSNPSGCANLSWCSSVWPEHLFCNQEVDGFESLHQLQVNIWVCNSIGRVSDS